MRFCGGFLAFQQVSCPEKGPQTHSVAGQSVGSALLPVDHTDGRTDDETGLAERRDRLDERPSRGHDVLDEAHELAEQFIKQNERKKTAAPAPAAA